MIIPQTAKDYRAPLSSIINRPPTQISIFISVDGLAQLHSVLAIFVCAIDLDISLTVNIIPTRGPNYQSPSIRGESHCCQVVISSISDDCQTLLLPGR